MNHAMSPDMHYPPGFPIHRVEEQSPQFRSQFFEGIQGSPVDPVNYRIPDPSPYLNPYQGSTFPAPDFETGHFEMARTNLHQNIDDEVVEVLGHRTMTMALENAENRQMM